MMLTNKGRTCEEQLLTARDRLKEMREFLAKVEAERDLLAKLVVDAMPFVDDHVHRYHATVHKAQAWLVRERARHGLAELDLNQSTEEMES